MTTNLLDCIAHNTSVEAFLSYFDGDTTRAALHLIEFYEGQLAETGEELSADERETLWKAARRDLNKILATA